MAFGSSFLPTPKHIQDFKAEAKRRFWVSADKAAIQRNQVKFLDALDMISDLLSKSGWPVAEQEAYLAELLRIDVWGNPAMLDDCTDAEAFVAALEASLDAAEAQATVEDALASSVGLPTASDIQLIQEWIESADFTGSEKQIKWAKDIAAKKAEQLWLCQKQGRDIPTSAKWWIDHRDENLLVSIP